MKSMLLLKRVKVSNANTIAGLTWGFPAITHFLGFTHALSRHTNATHGVELKGCGVVCHDFQHKTQRNQYDRHSFALTRNPLTSKGETAPFNEEGKMHMTVSLVIDADLFLSQLRYADTSNAGVKLEFEKEIEHKIFTMRLAGGSIESVEQVELVPSVSEVESKVLRRQLKTLIPGFVLVDASHLLPEKYQQLKTEDENTDFVDAWLDFSTLKYRAESLPDQEKETVSGSVEWQLHNKNPGYLVPLMVGYKGISPCYDNSQVSNARDDTTPFRFVESAYGVGQWLSPHRIQSAEQLLWQYCQFDDWYLCKNAYHTDGQKTDEEFDVNDYL